MRTLLTVILLSLQALHLQAQPRYKEYDSRLQQLCEAYEFMQIQNGLTAYLQVIYPELKPQADECLNTFLHSALGNGAKGVYAELPELMGDEWAAYEQSIDSQIKEGIPKQETTRSEAEEFFEMVNERAQGSMSESTRMILLSAHEAYAASPFLEMKDGWKQIYRTQGHPKAKGIDISISLPMSWSKREGDRPNIIQVFRSGAGHGDLALTLIGGKLPVDEDYEWSHTDLVEFFTSIEPGNDIKVLERELITIDGAPAEICVFKKPETLQGEQVQVGAITVDSIYKNQIINILLRQTGGNFESFDKELPRLKSTMMAIASTVIWNNRYNY